MNELIQANFELHEELGKKVRINLENEAKIKRLERQQIGYEKDTQYLYNIIEKLESQRDCDKKEIHSLKAQLSESDTRLKNSIKLCDEKEKFILFRDNQLLDSESFINNLKHQVLALSKSEIASSSRTRPALPSMSNN